MKLTEERMYQASLDKDSSFEGTYWMAVKTTGIFCRPTCTARKPKKENVEFFLNTDEAIEKGYRACKICRPLEKLNETPPYIQELLDELHQNESVKIKDADLLKRNIEPVTIRRWFLKNHGMTFQAFQREFRMSKAFKKIKNGESIIETALDSGYESLSGFNERFKNILGVSPKNSKIQMIIDLKRIETPLGTMFACAVDEGICLLEFTDRKNMEKQFISLSKALNAEIVQGENKHFTQLEQELKEYFEGKRQKFEVPLYTTGTEFQKKVWQLLREIPIGETRTYKQQSEFLGNPKAVRAVGTANGINKIAIIIPCHRVIGSNGDLIGYAGGIWRKQKLLELEKAILF
ncbi:AraC family transcriptional regulator of adaptative response/methylated-DNA-[protein]-cysteine methyltransferase [Chryseobacterium sp. H1D6B]|uniref:bifunctional transcriptional activator/DNA repair enzyme AdaA n=1 Tax=Chryseobacterium sp. H1D6B TaxID=2940588 RepID=UPI0015C71530|nr:methylated-DNA--[protein]-cysteine S-methyltransferase [Chryseobacterium sp. H1D6B]MDH6253325.1 AraC family transcriptional regulator of adaptative response/methylated-DNA-[protein]-cysteine methyltransferase [Chryseobacterium sp. H1D6B]